MNDNDESRFFWFDTFIGLPENWSSVFGKRSFDAEGNIQYTDDHRISFIKGLFQETLGVFLENYSPKGRLIVMIDSDLYSSALYVLFK